MVGRLLAPLRRAANAICLEHTTKCGKRVVEAAIHDERRWRFEQPSYLGHRQPVVEAQPKDQAIGGRESLERTTQQGGALVPQHHVVGRVRIGEQLETHHVPDEVGQEAALHMPVAVGRLKATVALPVVVDAQTSHHNEEPRCELAMSIGHISTQACMIVATQLIDDELVGAHDRVVVPAARPRDVQDQPAVLLEKRRPRGLSPARVGRGYKPDQHIGRRKAHGWSGRIGRESPAS